jgi:hypothetical protein
LEENECHYWNRLKKNLKADTKSVQSGNSELSKRTKEVSPSPVCERRPKSLGFSEIPV